MGDLPVPVESLNEGRVEIRTEDELKVLHALSGWALERGIRLPGLSVARVTLEDVYLALTREKRIERHPTTGSFQGLSDVKLVVRQTWYEQLSFWLNPIGAVFTVGFSLVFLVLLGASAGNSRISYLGNIRLIQYYVPGFVAYGVMAACFNILAITLVNRREMGLLKRLRLCPLPTWVLLMAVVLSSMIIAAIQVIILLVVGRVGFDVHPPSQRGGVHLRGGCRDAQLQRPRVGHEHARPQPGRRRARSSASSSSSCCSSPASGSR